MIEKEKVMRLGLRRTGTGNGAALTEKENGHLNMTTCGACAFLVVSRHL